MSVHQVARAQNKGVKQTTNADLKKAGVGPKAQPASKGKKK